MTLSPGDHKYAVGDTITLPLADTVTRDDVAGKAVTFNGSGNLVLLEDNSSVLVGTVLDEELDDTDSGGDDGFVSVQIAGPTFVVETSDDTPVRGDYLQPTTGGFYEPIPAADTGTVDALEGRPFVVGEEDAINTNSNPRSDKNSRDLYVAVFR